MVLFYDIRSAVVKEPHKWLCDVDLNAEGDEFFERPCSLFWLGVSCDVWCIHVVCGFPFHGMSHGMGCFLAVAV